MMGLTGIMLPLDQRLFHRLLQEDGIGLHLSSAVGLSAVCAVPQLHDRTQDRAPGTGHLSPGCPLPPLKELSSSILEMNVMNCYPRVDLSGI